MEAAFAWARGAKFGDVQKMSGALMSSRLGRLPSTPGVWQAPVEHPAMNLFRSCVVALRCVGAGVFEGSLIRAVRRLEEALRQLEGAAAAAGEAQLAAKFHTAGQSVKRDVVFAASLFL